MHRLRLKDYLWDTQDDSEEEEPYKPGEELQLGHPQ